MRADARQTEVGRKSQPVCIHTHTRTAWKYGGLYEKEQQQGRHVGTSLRRVV
jgi:hypothetical protein